MNVLSLFSGIGGLDLGLERAGMTVVGQVEIDEYCRKVLDKHWPEVPQHDDVRTCVEWWHNQPRPDIDLICGGFPCQPVSIAGRQLAQQDERWLWPAMAVAIRQLEPRWVLVENVPGLLARGMGDVLGDLATLGYDAEWDCVSASAVGAPHQRDRVWIVAADTARAGVRQQPVTQPRSGGQAFPIADGTDGSVEDADGGTVESRRGRRRTTETGELADTDEFGRHGRARIFRAGRRFEPMADAAGTRAHSDWWSAEPDVGRVAHGVPHRMDRLRALGNAVVPQVAEHIGQLILDAERAGVAP